jgi:hypothetical protein
VDQTTDRAGHLLELSDLGRELPAPLRREVIEARAAVVVGLLPLAGHPSLHQHPLKGRVQRAFLDLEHVPRRALDVLGDPVAVQRAAPVEGLEHEHVQRARRDGRSFFHSQAIY